MIKKKDGVWSHYGKDGKEKSSGSLSKVMQDKYLPKKGKKKKESY